MSPLLALPPLVFVIGSALMYRKIDSLTTEAQRAVESIEALMCATDSFTEPLEHASSLFSPLKEKSSENF
ncbi:MAG TPA: hypothetical protein DCP89_03355 [Acidimicrobiaceae bacterium]|nr:hypothetical protein [Actinomycetota bacterium]HAN07513.1 hypothetical protein [Acidimicrobiaceae bacterium]